MATFDEVAAGIEARHTFEFPLPGAKADAETGAWTGRTQTVDVRPLTPGEELAVIGAAIRDAKAAGVADPAEGDAAYDLALRIHTIAVGLVDVDSPKDAPAPYFPGGAEQIRRVRGVTRDHIAYAYEKHQAWQDECSPSLRNMTQTQYLQAVTKSAGGDIGPFLQMSPGTRWAFLRSMAAQLVASLAANSASTSPSPATAGN